MMYLDLLDLLSNLPLGPSVFMVYTTEEKATGVFTSVPSLCSTTYITCPADPKKTLGIKLPFLVMIIKNLKKYFTFEVQVSRCT